MLVDASFSAKTINICKLVDSKYMSLVEWNAVKSLASSDSFRGGGVFYECESNLNQYEYILRCMCPLPV